MDLSEHFEICDPKYWPQEAGSVPISSKVSDVAVKVMQRLALHCLLNLSLLTSLACLARRILGAGGDKTTSKLFQLFETV